MNNNNRSLVEIAYNEMKTKRKPRTLERITKDVFEIKGINPKQSADKISQFAIDFMLSGYFVCCGEDKSGKKLWDLKTRQEVSLLDKDGSYLEALYKDEEADKYELSDNIVYKPSKDFDDDDYNSDEEEEEEDEQTDDVEALIFEEYGDSDEEGEEEDDEAEEEEDLLDDVDFEELDEEEEDE